VNLTVRPTSRQPVWCLRTPHRRTLFGEGWGRWEALVRWVVQRKYNQGSYVCLPREYEGEVWSEVYVNRAKIHTRHVHSSRLGEDLCSWPRATILWQKMPVQDCVNTEPTCAVLCILNTGPPWHGSCVGFQAPLLPTGILPFKISPQVWIVFLFILNSNCL